jgi:hypothetical protein
MCIQRLDKSLWHPIVEVPVRFFLELAIGQRRSVY